MRMRHVSLACALVVGVASAAHAQVAFIAGNGAGTQSASTLDSGTFTIGSQANKALCAIVTWSTHVGATVTSVVWDPSGAAQSLSAVASASTSGNRRVQAFALANPAAVTNGVVRVTWSDSTIGSQAVYAAAFSGANQSAPCQDFASASGTSTAPSVTVTNVTSDDMVMDGLISAFFIDSVGANQTTIGSEAAPGDLHWASYQDGADGGVMSWTLLASDPWLIGGVRVVSAGGGGGASTHQRLLLLGVGE